ncbi:MAG TPA: hypothetical protein VMD06_03850 [Steroidobacteraceae bacterium]|jgi:hypothetical protein|nr:hypothetical protein [Steroidobacteraceae bacterium]
MLPTITIESTRLVSTFDMGALAAVVVALAAIGWMTMTRLRHHRHR